MRARRSARYRAIRAQAYVLGSWTVAAAAVPVDLEGAAGTAWSEAQTRQTHSIIENSPVYKDLLAETKQLFAQPSFSEYTPFPIVRLYGDTVYGFDEHGFYSTTWRRFLASALPKNPAFLMSTMAAVQSGVWFPRPWENLQCLPLAPARCELTLSSGGVGVLSRSDCYPSVTRLLSWASHPSVGKRLHHGISAIHSAKSERSLRFIMEAQKHAHSYHEGESAKASHQPHCASGKGIDFSGSAATFGYAHGNYRLIRLIMKGEKSPFESKTTAPQRAHCVGYRGPDICEGRDGDDPDTAQQDRPGGGGGYRVPLEGDGAAPAALVEGRETYGRGSISQACRP